jgi:carbamoyl-phosphate synthase large subunit
VSTDPRVLVTGVGGPSGVSILRAMAGRPVAMLGGDIDPYAAGLYLLDPDRRHILPRGDDPRIATMLLDLCRAEEVDVLIPTVDTELLPLARARAEFAEAGVTLVVAQEETLAVCLDKWRLAERCQGKVRVPDTQLVDARFDPSAPSLPAIVKPRSGSGSLLVQEHLPGPEHSLDVLARADGHVAAVVPRERLKVDSGIAVTGRTKHDPKLDAFAREVARLIGLTTVANVQVKEDAAGEPALLEVNPRFPGTMPLTVASGVDMPRLAIGEALGTPIPDGPIEFQDIAMVRYFEERFFSFDDISDLQARAARIAV